MDRDSSVPKRKLELTDITMKVQLLVGDVVTQDCNCDSEYMIGAMDRIGEAIRKKFSWIPRTQKCYLVMDNAGGHGTKEAIEQYVANLETNYAIEVIFQVPRSPYTNVLDLGVWCCLQAAVEKTHYMRRCEVNALVASVMETWENGHLDESISKVFSRLKIVLHLIHEAKGRNDLVETKRGKK